MNFSGLQSPDCLFDSVVSDIRHASRGSFDPAPARFSRSSDSHNNAHLDLTVEDVDVAVQEALELGATLSREKGKYPLGSTTPYLEWAVMKDPFGNAFCLIKDLD